MARSTSTPLLLVHQGQQPPDEWIQAAQTVLQASVTLACVTAGQTDNDPRPTLYLDLGAMMIRRDIFLESGGLSKTHQGIGDGLDLAWRLWFMGYKVLELPTSSSRPVALADPSLYLVYRSWLWTLVRNCDEANLGLALSRAMLRIMAGASTLLEDSPEIQSSRRPHPASRRYLEEVTRLRDWGASRDILNHRVTPLTGETLTVLHDMIPLLPVAVKERKSVQRMRCRSDRAIEAELGQDPAQATEEYFSQLGSKALAADSDRHSGYEGKSLLRIRS